MSSLSTAVKRTSLYSQFFNFPLTLKETHLWLISDRCYDLNKIKPFFKKHRSKQNLLIRSKLKEITLSKTKMALRAAKIISLFPSVRLIALTGSVAIGNPDPDDDIDLLVITSSNSLWLTRIFLIPIISLFFPRRTPKKRLSNSLCFNLWLDLAALSIPTQKRNLYTAHEVLQIKPLFDKGETYSKFILANSWTKKYLANAYTLIISIFPVTLKTRSVNSAHQVVRRKSYCLKFFNKIGYKLQRFYMEPKITKEYITLHSAFFHPRNFYPTIDAYLDKKMRTKNS